MTPEELQREIDIQEAVVVAIVALHQAQLKKLRALQAQQDKEQWK
jgi:hypothetical protein